MTCNSTFVLHVAIYSIINLLTGGLSCMTVLPLCNHLANLLVRWSQHKGNTS